MAVELERRRRSRAVIAIIVCLILLVGGYGIYSMMTAHGRSDLVGATLRDGRQALVVSLCKGESVKSIFINDSRSQDGEGQTLWRLDATRPTDSETFVIGDVPSGYRETVHIAGTLPRRPLTAWAITKKRDGSSSFTMAGLIDFDHVKAGRIYVDERPISDDDFYRGLNCGSAGYRH